MKFATAKAAPRPPMTAPPLLVAVELPADLIPRIRRPHRRLDIEDLEALIVHVLRRVCDRMEAEGDE